MRSAHAALIGAFFSLAAFAQTPRQTAWVGTWASSQQIPEPQNALPSAYMTDITLRETVHVSLGGSMLRVRLSNAFGTQPLHLTSVHIAKPAGAGSSSIDISSDHQLLFNGSADVTIPPAAEFLSDPVPFALAPLSDLTISFHIEKQPGQQTGHPGSRQVSFYSYGDLTAAADLPQAHQAEHWYMLTGVDVQRSPQAYSIVALGDSITDGHATTVNKDDRWTDVLAQKLQEDSTTREASVLNQGIGGNHLLTDGLGPNVLARFDRDVLAQPGVRYLIVLEGINDLGALSRTEGATPEAHTQLVHSMIAAYQQIVQRAHAAGIVVYGGTIMPDSGSGYYHPDAASEQDRRQLNEWIRRRGNFDAVIDFDHITADPASPARLLPAYDSGDHLHPGPAGYHAMGSQIPLSLFLSGPKTSRSK